MWPSVPNPMLSSQVLFLNFWTASGQLIILGNSIPFSNTLITLDLTEEKSSTTSRFFSKNWGQFWSWDVVMCVLGGWERHFSEWLLFGIASFWARTMCSRPFFSPGLMHWAEMTRHFNIYQALPHSDQRLYRGKKQRAFSSPSSHNVVHRQGEGKKCWHHHSVGQVVQQV